MPTPRQALVLKAVRDMESAGQKPTIQSIMDAIGSHSTNSVHRMCGLLVDQGWLGRDPVNGRLHVARDVEDEVGGEPLSDDPLVLFIHRHQIENDGSSPTRRQMRDAMGTSSMSHIAARFQSLVDRGMLMTRANGNRANTAGAITVVKKIPKGS